MTTATKEKVKDKQGYVVNYVKAEDVSVEIDERGVAHLTAVILREGPMKYARPGIGIRTELVPAEEIEVAAETASGAPVTDGHPPDFLNRDNISNYVKGLAGTDYEITEDSEGRRILRQHIMLHDSKLVDQVMDGKRMISTGRSFQVVDEAGEFAGEAYDVIQSNTKINHIAIVDRGRAGEAVSIDSETDVERAMISVLGGDKMDEEQQEKTPKGGINMELDIGNKSYALDVDESVEGTLQKIADDANAQIAEAKDSEIAEDASLQFVADMYELSVDDLKKALDGLMECSEDKKEKSEDSVDVELIDLVASIKAVDGEYSYTGQDSIDVKLDAARIIGGVDVEELAEDKREKLSNEDYVDGWLSSLLERAEDEEEEEAIDEEEKPRGQAPQLNEQPSDEQDPVKLAHQKFYNLGKE